MATGWKTAPEKQSVKHVSSMYFRSTLRQFAAQTLNCRHLPARGEEPIAPDRSLSPLCSLPARLLSPSTVAQSDMTSIVSLFETALNDRYSPLQGLGR